MGFHLVKLTEAPVQITMTGGIQFDGDYSAGTEYTTGDVVTYEGSSYVAITGTTGNLPTNATYWQLMAAKGATGNNGEAGSKGDKGDQGNPGVVQSVNGQSIATVVLDPDDLDDASTSHKFVSSSHFIVSFGT